MFSYLEALVTFAESQSMNRAAARLKVTQSTISKRISALERELGKKVIERSGRRAVLTAYGAHLLEQARPLMVELKETLSDERVETRGRITIAVSQAILISWGADMLAHVARKHPELDLHIGAFEGRVAVENVRSGEFAVALCRGSAESAPELAAEFLLEEPMVVVPSGLRPFRFPKSGVLEVISVEPHTDTFGVLRRRGKRAAARWGFELNVAQHYQTAAAVAQMARAGFGHGVVPLGVAAALGVPRDRLVRFPGMGLSVPVSLVGRRTTLALPHVQALLRALRTNLPQHASTARRTGRTRNR